MDEPAFLKKSAFFFYKHPVAVLFLLWSISVIVRLPNLNRPLSKHHELNPALVLINAEEWNRETPEFYYYVPVNSYHLPGDDVDSNIIKSNGYLVNNSFGALWYIMPYMFFKVLHLSPSPLLLQMFNLLLHFITILLIYKIALHLFSAEDNPISKALVTVVIYLFSPAPLWFHGNGYVHEVAVLPFILGVCLVYIKIRESNAATIWQYFLLSILIIGGTCCDWLMCFVAATIFAVSFWLRIKTRQAKYIYCMIPASAAIMISLSITVGQFSAFMGFNNYVEGLLSRFTLRGISGEVKPAGVLSKAGLASFYLAGYGAIIPFLLLCIFFRRRGIKSIRQNKKLKSFILIASIVCCMHHVVFWGFSNIHDYSVVKSGFVLSLLSAVALFSFTEYKHKMFVLMCIITLNTGVYYFINRPGYTSINGQPYSYFKTLGEKIKAIATPDDYIFIDTPEMSLLLTYYSKRYYKNVKDINEATTLFKTLQGKNAVFVHTSNFNFISSTRLHK